VYQLYIIRCLLRENGCCCHYETLGQIGSGIGIMLLYLSDGGSTLQLGVGEVCWHHLMRFRCDFDYCTFACIATS